MSLERKLTTFLQVILLPACSIRFSSPPENWTAQRERIYHVKSFRFILTSIIAMLCYSISCHEGEKCWIASESSLKDRSWRPEVLMSRCLFLQYRSCIIQDVSKMDGYIYVWVRWGHQLCGKSQKKTSGSVILLWLCYFSFQDLIFFFTKTFS